MIAVVAIIVVGPKDLPRMLRTLGKTMGQLRRTANEFKRQFDDALKEAEQQADFEDTRKSLEDLGKIDPLADVRKELDSVSSIGSDIKTVVEKPSGKPKTEKPAGKASQPATNDSKPMAKPKPKAGPAKGASKKAAAAKRAKAEPPIKAPAPTGGSDTA